MYKWASQIRSRNHAKNSARLFSSQKELKRYWISSTSQAPASSAKTRSFGVADALEPARLPQSRLAPKGAP